MPSFKSFDFGRTYINLDRVEQISSHRDLFDPEVSFIRLAGVERAIAVNLPLHDLLFRLGIPADPGAKPEAERIRREATANTRRWERESLGLRDFEETQLKTRKQAREEQARQQQERKPVQSERRARKRGPTASASRTDQG